MYRAKTRLPDEAMLSVRPSALSRITLVLWLDHFQRIVFLQELYAVSKINTWSHCILYL